MAELKTYTGEVQEISQTSDNPRAPHKVMINDGGEFSKTFRVWPNADKSSTDPSPELLALGEAMHKEVTVYYEEEQKSGAKGSWTQNTIRSVGNPPKGAAPSNNSWAPSGITEETVRQIVREELRLANVYSAFPGTTDETPDYTDFKNTADQEGFNENGLEKRWAKFQGEGHWHHATQDQLEKFAVELGFKWPSKLVEVGAPEGSF